MPAVFYDSIIYAEHFLNKYPYYAQRINSKNKDTHFTSRYLLSAALLAAAPAFAEYSYSPLYPTTGELTISASGACKFKQTYQTNIGLIKDSNNPDPNATIFGALDEDGNLLMALSHQTSEADIKSMSLVQVRDKQGTLISESEKGAIYTALNPDSLR